MPEKLTKSHIAALEAAGIAIGALPRDGIEWNEKVWAVFRAGMKYETENIRRETIEKCKTAVEMADDLQEAHDIISALAEDQP